MNLNFLPSSFFSETALQDLFSKSFFILKKIYSFPILELILNNFKQYFTQAYYVVSRIC